MISSLVWNVRGINTQGVMERIKSFKTIHHLSFVAILEPFSDSSKLQNFRIQLNMDFLVCNSNNNIWLLCIKEVDCRLIHNEEQHITCVLKHVMCPHSFMMTFVYSKCKHVLRKPLWDRLLVHANTISPWCAIGDFNVITSPEEKLGGVPYNMKKSFEFINTIEACGFIDIGFNGQEYTCCNHMDSSNRIWKRLDRALVNDKWLENMPHTSIYHLPSVGSDHCPLLMKMVNNQVTHIKYFKFLNYWADQPSFMNTVSNCWNNNSEGNPMWVFHPNLKRLCSTLTFGPRLPLGIFMPR